MEVGFFPEKKKTSLKRAGQWDVAGYLNKAMIISNAVMGLAASVQAVGMFLRFQ